MTVCIRMLSQRWNSFHVCSAYFKWWFWNRLWFPLMLSMRENWLLIGWACARIGYSMAEHAQKWLVVGWACARIGYSMAEQWACTKNGQSLAEHARKLVTRYCSWAYVKLSTVLFHHKRKCSIHESPLPYKSLPTIRRIFPSIDESPPP